MRENPFYENLRKAALEEKQQMEQIARNSEDYDSDLTREEIEDIAEDMYQKMKDSIMFSQQCDDTLPDLYAQLIDLSAEWRTITNQKKQSDASQEEKLRWQFYSGMSHSARDEAKRIQWVMEEYV